METWKTIPGTKGLYEASTLGLIRSHAEAYKAALRREIEKRRAQLQKEQAVHIKGSDWHTAIENRLRELQIFEDSLDTVEP